MRRIISSIAVDFISTDHSSMARIPTSLHVPRDNTGERAADPPPESQPADPGTVSGLPYSHAMGSNGT